MKKISLFFKATVHYKQWEIAKYLLISLAMFSPALISFFYHVENEYYVGMDHLLSFLAFSFASFSLMIIFRIKRVWTIPFILFAVFCDAYHLAMGKAIGFQTMAAMYETNLTEMIGFLSSPYSIPLLLGGALCAAGLIWYIVYNKPIYKLKKDTHIRRHFLLFLMVLSLALFICEGKTIAYTYPLDIFYTNYCYIDESLDEKDYLKNQYEFDFRHNESLKDRGGEVYVLVIGEAARRSSMHAYGSPMQTTPCLDEFIRNNPNNIVLFQDAVSGSAYTRGSVPTILSTYNINDINKLFKRPSLSKMLRGAEFKTLYVTARPRYLRPNVVSIFQDDAEEVHYLTTLKNKVYDADTVPVIKDFMKKYPEDKKLIIVHLRGSHIEYSMQYPEEERYFNSGDEIIDSYNDTIRYSDEVIHQVVDIVMEQKQPGFLLYLSDHGENLNDYGDGNYGHGTRNFTRFEFEIPFIAYFNDAFLETFPEAKVRISSLAAVPISQDNVSHTFLGLAGVTDPEFYRSNQDLSSQDFSPQKRYIIDENMNIYNYDETVASN